jgi:hypothetical protein
MCYLNSLLRRPVPLGQTTGYHSFLSNRRVLSEKLLVKEEEEEPELTPGR